MPSATLPSSPRATSLPSRSRSASRPRYANTETKLSRGGSERMAAYPLPSSPRLAGWPSPPSRYGSRGLSSSTSSSDVSSVSSSGSSFLERMKMRSSATTPRTSLEEEKEVKLSSQGDWPPVKDGEGDNEAGAMESNGTWGSSIWNRLASAAGSLTVNVDLSWAANITADAGEETPIGQESRLTQAMKAYHIGKAQDPSDLPSWLFNERERRAVPGLKSAQPWASSNGYHTLKEDLAIEASRGGGLRDIYDAAAASSRNAMPPVRTRDLIATESVGGTKATNRLKAIRDAKRQVAAPTYVESQQREESVTVRSEPHKDHSHHSGDWRRDAHGRLDIEAPRRPSQGRVGLPSRPARAHARGF